MDARPLSEYTMLDGDPGDENDFDIRQRLAPGLKRGERVVDGDLKYSAAWLDDEGKEHPIGERP